MSRTIIFKVEPELNELIEKTAQKEQRSLASLSRVALQEYCEEALKDESN